MTSGQAPRQRSRDKGCWQCGHVDQLVSVPAAVRDGRSAGVVRGSITGRYGYDVPVKARVVQVSALARTLAAPVRPRTVTKPAIALGISGWLAVWNLQLAVLGPTNGTAWFGVVFFALVALASGWVLRVRLRQAQSMGPLVDEAIGLWRRSWYCRRCGVVSVYGSGRPAVVQASGLAAALVAMAGQRRQQAAPVARPPVPHVPR